MKTTWLIHKLKPSFKKHSGSGCLDATLLTVFLLNLGEDESKTSKIKNAHGRVTIGCVAGQVTEVMWQYIYFGSWQNVVACPTQEQRYISPSYSIQVYVFEEKSIVNLGMLNTINKSIMCLSYSVNTTRSSEKTKI